MSVFVHARKGEREKSKTKQEARSNTTNDWDYSDDFFLSLINAEVANEQKQESHLI